MYNSVNRNSDFIQFRLVHHKYTWLHRNIDIIIAYVENKSREMRTM